MLHMRTDPREGQARHGQARHSRHRQTLASIHMKDKDKNNK